MERARTVFTVTLTILVLALGTLLGLGIWYRYDVTNYNHQIKQAEKSIALSDYNRAIDRYKRAIELNPRRKDAYEQLAKLYVSMEQKELARETLEEGVRSGNFPLRDLIVQLGLEESEPEREHPPISAPVQAEAVQLTPPPGSTGDLNTGTFLLLKNNTYGSYVRQGRIVTSAREDTGEMLVRVSLPEASLWFDVAAGVLAPGEDSLPTRASAVNLAGLLGGEGQVTMEQLRSLGAEDMALEQDSQRGWLLTFTLEQCRVNTAADSQGNVAPYAWNRIELPISARQNVGSTEIYPVPQPSVQSDPVPPPAPDTQQSQPGEDKEREYMVSGKIVDEENAAILWEVEIQVLENVSGYPLVLRSSTGVFGTFSFSVKPGDYILTCDHVGYDFKPYHLHIEDGDITGVVLKLQSLKAEGQIKLTLEWDAQSGTDLDSCLEGQNGDGSRVSISYQNTTCYLNGDLAAQLVGDQQMGGPEVITLFDVSGTYEYRIKKYSGDASIQEALPRVTVQPISGSPYTITCENGAEEEWLVLTIQDGEIYQN